MIPSSKMVLVCCVFYILFRSVTYGWPTFCPVTSPLYDAVYITDDPSKSLVGLTKTGCATQCAFCADVDVNCGATKCSSFNYNSTSMNCSLFYFQPTTTAVDSTSTTIAYQFVANPVTPALWPTIQCSSSFDYSQYRNSDDDTLCTFDYFSCCLPNGSLAFCIPTNGTSPQTTVLAQPVVDAKDCSFPFTYNGIVWYNCTGSITSATCGLPHSCLMANRTIAICHTSTDYVADTVNVSIQLDNLTDVSTLSVVGWIVWMRRVDLTFSWSRGWISYRNGFGSADSNFWLGLERVHLLTTSTAHRLPVEVQQSSDGKWYSAEYWSFWIGDEINQKYRLNVAGYSGDAGDSLQYTGGWQGGDNGQYNHNGMKFTTNDNDNDLYSGGNMASISGGGWWYNVNYWACTTCAGSNAQWCTMPSGWYLKAARMMIKLQ